MGSSRMKALLMITKTIDEPHESATLSEDEKGRRLSSGNNIELDDRKRERHNESEPQFVHTCGWLVTAFYAVAPAGRSSSVMSSATSPAA